MIRAHIIAITLLSWMGLINVMAVDVSLNSEEQELYRLIMEYRAQKSLPSIPLSPALTYVAQTHVRDLQTHPRAEGCNLHAWSDFGDWTPVCCTKNPSEEALKAVWNKPRELTTYPGAGYEISHWYSAGATARSAINGWKNSPPHNATMINLDIWSTITWRAIGIGIYKEYAVVWFGEEEDKAATKEQKKEQTPITVIPNVNIPLSQDESTEKRLKELEGQLQQLRKEQAQAANSPLAAKQQALIEKQDYDVDKDFYISAIGGLALNLTAARHVPMEIRVEYRHPVWGATTNAVNPQGFYAGAQIYFGSYFQRKR